MSTPSSVVPVSAFLVTVTALIFVAIAAVIWTRHRKFLAQRSPRSIVLFCGLVLGAGDCLNNIIMIATSSEYPPQSYYFGRLLYYPNPGILYMASVYRLVILILKRQTRQRLLAFSWFITIVIQANGFYGFYVRQSSANGDPVLASYPNPVWATVPAIFFLIASIGMSVATLMVLRASSKMLDSSKGSESVAPGAAAQAKGAQPSAAASSGQNNSIYFPLSTAFKWLTALYITLWLLFFVIFFLSAAMDRRLNAIAISLLGACGLLAECCFEFLLRYTRNKQTTKGSSPAATTGAPSVSQTRSMMGKNATQASNTAASQ
ncbi:hypothetical protein RI367_000135 [Sorochytrium milnesiophthora]